MVSRMGKYTVLICDDNMAVHSSLTSYLKSEGIDVVSSFDGESALEALRTQNVDVMVLDVMLPGMDGHEVCREVRKISNVYIIMLSAKGDELDLSAGEAYSLDEDDGDDPDGDDFDIRLLDIEGD